MTLSSTRSLALAGDRVNLALRSVVVSVCAASAGVPVALVPDHLGESLALGLAFALSAGFLALTALVDLSLATSVAEVGAAAAATLLITRKEPQ